MVYVRLKYCYIYVSVHIYHTFNRCICAVSVDFFFVLCSDLLFYGEEVTGGLLSMNGKGHPPKRYKFHRELFLDEILLVLNPNESKSFIIRGIDKGE